MSDKVKWIKSGLQLSLSGTTLLHQLSLSQFSVLQENNDSLVIYSIRECFSQQRTASPVTGIKV